MAGRHRVPSHPDSRAVLHTVGHTLAARRAETVRTMVGRCLLCVERGVPDEIVERALCHLPGECFREPVPVLVDDQQEDGDTSGLTLRIVISTSATPKLRRMWTNDISFIIEDGVPWEIIERALARLPAEKLGPTTLAFVREFFGPRAGNGKTDA
jgi:hypothetical protein